jgi:tetratricopeptide (TPR) repeat protein
VKPRTPVRSAYARFAEAYLQLMHGRHKEAYGKFDGLATYYDVLNRYSWALPYYAFAAARSGNSAQLEPHIDAIDAQHRGFDYYLAKAVFAALSGEHAQAERLLESAFQRKPFTERRPIFVEYQYAQVCVWLHEATGHKPYRDRALDWARKHQVMLPFFSWAYALEAKLTDNPEARRRALAIALYLDPDSISIAAFDAKARTDASAWFKSHDPFRRTKSDKAI